MAKRFSDTEIWDKQWYMNLKPCLKCLVDFVRDKCDLAGVWSPNWTLAVTYIGEKVTEKQLLEIDGGNQFLKTDEGKIWCIGFVDFQYGGKLNPASPVHKKIIDILRRNNLNGNSLLAILSNTLPSTHKEEEEDMDKDTGKEEEGVECLCTLPEQFPFSDFWESYDKKVGDRAKLEKKWAKLPEEERRKAMNHVPFYKQATPDKQFRKNPETYINNKSWHDELISDKIIIMKPKEESEPDPDDFFSPLQYEEALSAWKAKRATA